jgi:hypothetical protein
MVPPRDSLPETIEPHLSLFDELSDLNNSVAFAPGRVSRGIQQKLGEGSQFRSIVKYEDGAVAGLCAA